MNVIKFNRKTNKNYLISYKKTHFFVKNRYFCEKYTLL